MKKTLFIGMLLVLPCMVVAVDDELEERNAYDSSVNIENSSSNSLEIEKEQEAQQGDDEVEPEVGEQSSDPLVPEGMFSTMGEKLPTFSLSDQQQLALRKASLIGAGLLTMGGNAVGRLILMGFFTHKAFKNMRKLCNEEYQKSEYALKAACYGMATYLLAQDGYAWLLKQ